MATRRTGITRSRSQTQSSMPPPRSTSSRPQSAMAKPGPHRSTAPTPVNDPAAFELVPPVPPLPSSRHAKPPSSRSGDDSETHIQVVIRCRRRSEREVQENSAIIVTSQGARSNNITIETATPVSSLGVLTLPPTRTYPFDLVFGPEADQAMIYQDVVHPMLEEVLMGYNCTLFAYGQTGTGKTHTMQGDLGTTPMGNPTAQSGMIPRVLFRLFQQLESSSADYSVKISYIELYNEELRDLLASELAEPSGNSQPMGMGSRDGAGSQGGLKIFDDASKRGVLIQGLEEIAVKSAPDALALLVKGSDRRQIAATKFNDHSSRSHSVFSITVHTKETSSIGDDLLRVGKLNLVDLAGSENIGRSGAENKRAREAGMINQSLLTLGRVINALVERSSHIPYRESKLTRLLQDSLGGRTKTCLIATISPARSNMEETLSTLDYAIRAKSIRNRPEVNQRMTRNSLLKEYIGEIERLKADLLAAREKNGIFFSEDTWNQMSAEHEIARTEMEESKRQVEIVESQLRSVREEFEESMNMLMKRDGELKETRERLVETTEVLGIRETQLKTTKGALEEEIVVRKAHQQTEATLDEVARGLKKTAQETVSDLHALFAKLSRQVTISSSNSSVVLNQGKTLTSHAQKVSGDLDAFLKASTQAIAKVKEESEQFRSKEMDAVTIQSNRISEQIQRVHDSMRVIQAKDEASGEAISSAQLVVKEAHDNIRAIFTSWSEKLKVSTSSMCSDIEKSSLTGYQTVEKALSAMATLIQTVIRETQQHLDSERKNILETKMLAETAANAEVRHLREQNARLVQLLQSEKGKSDRAKDELIKRVSGLLGDFVSERDRSLREVFADLQDGNSKAEGVMSQFAGDVTQRIDGAISRGQECSGALEKKGESSKRMRDGALKSLAGVNDALRNGLTNMQNAVVTSLASSSADLQKQTHTLSATSTDAFERHARAKRARIEATNAMSVDVQSGYRQVQRAMASTSRGIEASTSKVVAESSKMAESHQAFHSTATEHLSAVRQATATLLEEGAREDLPTGKTPRKRTHEHAGSWELTKDRETLIRDWKQRLTVTRPSPSPSDSLSSSSSSLRSPREIADVPSPSSHIFDADSLSSPATPRFEDVTARQSDNVEVHAGLVSEVTVPSLVSSMTSTLASSLDGPLAKGKLGIPKPTMGTLTERSTNLISIRPRRAAR
ncbi:kinesin-domain-containing protein [Auriscalpium vulgare]|uniref:Kinesin-domain-containing protein n=1 Tax=Auriscalpium vulgare TaxID=40419 RepID=A0ACB8SDY5_9AGAM|nr:kinesin-domain-containing protein [Auriscalpium vulgare]